MRRWIGLFFAAIVLALAALAAYLASADLGRHERQIIPLISKALGRDLRVEGGLSLRLGRTVTLRAADVSVANAAWADDPYLVEADGIEAKVDFRSLIRGPIRVESLILRGAVVRLQVADDGRRNWSRPGADTAARGQGRVRAALRGISAFKASDVRVMVSAPNLTGVSEAVVDTAAYAVDAGRVTADASGVINGHPLTLNSRIGPAENRGTGSALQVHADVRMGEVDLTASIRLADADTLAVSSAELELAGPDIDYAFGVLKLPKITSGPLRVRADVTPDPQRSRLDADGQLGEYQFAVNGWLEGFTGTGGYDVSVRLSGPNLAALGTRVDIRDLPAAPFDVAANVRSRAERIEVSDALVNVGNASVRAQGALEWLPDGGKRLDASAIYRGMSSTLVLDIPAGWPASDLAFEFGAQSEDAIDAARYFGLDHLGGQPLELSASGTWGGRTVSLREARVGVGKQALGLTGRIELAPGAPDIDLRFDAERIDSSPWLGDRESLNARLGTITGTGRIKVSQGRLEADELALRSDGVALGGSVSLPLSDRGRSGEFALRLAAPAVERLFPGLAADALKGEAVEVSADGSFDRRSVSLRKANVGLGNQRLALTGRAGLVEDDADIDVRFDAEAVDLSRWLAGRNVPDPGLRSVAGTGRLTLTRGRLEADELRLRAHDVLLEGRVSLPLASKGRRGNFTLHLTAPDFAQLLPGLEGSMFGAQAVDLRGAGSWTAGAWQLDELLWRISGRGDLRGNVTFVGTPSPALSASLTAASLDLRPAGDATPTAPSAGTSDSFIPARKVAIPRFPNLDVDLEVHIDSLLSPVTAGASVAMAARLADDRLIVDKLETKGKRGQINASLTVDAQPDAPLAATLELTGRGLYIAAPDEPATALSARPRFDLETTLQATGTDVRELAKTLDGRLLIQAEQGTITRRGGVLVTLVMDDFLTRTLESINPLIRKRDEVLLNCFVVAADIQDGRIRGAPLVALQTTEVNLLTRGEVDLGSEVINLDIITRPRRGFGISLGDLINPFTRVGGTLAEPHMVADPKSALFETGAGIATGGAWVVAKKLRDRFFTGNPCAKALEARIKANQQRQ